MKKVIFTIVFTLNLVFLFSQQPNWGFGPDITVTGSSSITCSVFDPILNQTKTMTQSNVNNYISNQGVVAWVSSGGTVGGIIYDVNLHQFQYTTFSSNSGNTISNSDGVIAFVSSAGTVGGAIYNPCLQSWEYTTFSSNSGNSVVNNDGVIAFVSSAGTVGGAIYDPNISQWEYTTFSSNSGNQIMNNEGVISFVSSAGTVGGAVYDIASSQWKYTTFSSNTGNIMVNKDGIIAYKSTAGTLGGAVYNFNNGSWDYTTFSSSSSNTGLSINNGTIIWSNSSGSQKEGYSNGWSSGSNTQPSCRMYLVDNQTCQSNNKNIVYAWCMSYGANSYAYNAGDGHVISRRQGWKYYTSPGNYSFSLNVSNSNLNSSCSESINIVSGLSDNESAKYINIYPNPFCQSLKIENNSTKEIRLEVHDLQGAVLYNNKISTDVNFIDMSNLSDGFYMVNIYVSDILVSTKKMIKQK